MVVNFRTCGISRDTRKLARISNNNKKKVVYTRIKIFNTNQYKKLGRRLHPV